MKLNLKAVVMFALMAGLCLAGGVARAQEDTTLVVDGSTTVGPIAKAFAAYYSEQNPGVEISVKESGSGNGAKSLIAGECDVADMSRFMKEKEFKAAIDNGVFPVAHVVALDGIAISLNPANPVGKLTVEQVRKIYSGAISNWNQVGGPNLQIVVVSRDTASGTYETFEKLVMHGDEIAGGVEKVGSNTAMHKRVSATPAAIGYLGLGYVDDKVKAVEVNDIKCTKANIVSGRYPIARPLFMFTNGYPELGSHLYGFTTLHLSKVGQNIVQDIGFVPVTAYE
jgi:phosphate transport system substrate-binding protein